MVGLEIAHLSTPEMIGSAIGVNVRMTDYSGVNAEVIEELAEVISAAVIRVDAPCVSLPIRIATDGASDLEVTAPILKRCPNAIDVPPTVARLAELMPYVAQCRMRRYRELPRRGVRAGDGYSGGWIGGQLVLHAEVSRSGGPVSGRVPDDRFERRELEAIAFERHRFVVWPGGGAATCIAPQR